MSLDQRESNEVSRPEEIALIVKLVQRGLIDIKEILPPSSELMGYMGELFMEAAAEDASNLEDLIETQDFGLEKLQGKIFNMQQLAGFEAEELEILEEYHLIEPQVAVAIDQQIETQETDLEKSILIKLFTSQMLTIEMMEAANISSVMDRGLLKAGIDAALNSQPPKPAFLKALIDKMCNRGALTLKDLARGKIMFSEIRLQQQGFSEEEILFLKAAKLISEEKSATADDKVESQPLIGSTSVRSNINLRVDRLINDERRENAKDENTRFGLSLFFKLPKGEA